MTLPCKDCITLSICRSQVYELSLDDYKVLDIISILCNKCSILNNTLFGVNVYDDNVIVSLYDVYDFFRRRYK